MRWSDVPKPILPSRGRSQSAYIVSRVVLSVLVQIVWLHKSMIHYHTLRASFKLMTGWMMKTPPVASLRRSSHFFAAQLPYLDRRSFCLDRAWLVRSSSAVGCLMPLFPCIFRADSSCQASVGAKRETEVRSLRSNSVLGDGVWNVSAVIDRAYGDEDDHPPLRCSANIQDIGKRAHCPSAHREAWQRPSPGTRVC